MWHNSGLGCCPDSSDGVRSSAILTPAPCTSTLRYNPRTGPRIRVASLPTDAGPSADDGKMGTKLYHAVNMVVVVGVPAAVIVSPSFLTKPLDVIMSVALPLHAHIGMNYGELPLRQDDGMRFRCAGGSVLGRFANLSGLC